MNMYLDKCVHIKPSCVLGLFDKMTAPSLNYGSEVFSLVSFFTSQSTDMVRLGRSVHLTTLFARASLTKQLPSTTLESVEG